MKSMISKTRKAYLLLIVMVVVTGASMVYESVVKDTIPDEEVELPDYGTEKSFPAPIQRMLDPGIAYAVFRLRIVAEEDVEEPQIAFPIPLEFENQVPLYFELRFDPEDAVKTVVTRKRDEFNWICEVTFHHLNKGDAVDVKWDGFVLMRDRDYGDILSEKIEVAASEDLPQDVMVWLESTASVQADHPEIQETAKRLRGSGNDVVRICNGIAEFLNKIEFGDPQSTDAVEALHEGGYCTSYANLGAALFRTNGIPARILAVYPTLAPVLQTHYIVQFYVSGHGWVTLSSEGVSDRPYDYVVAAVVSPEDENESFDKSFWSGRGVPWMSVPESLSGPEISGHGLIDPQWDCDHGGGPVCEFDNIDHMEEAFALTQQVWNHYLEDITTGKETPRALAAQKKAVLCTNLDEYIEVMNQAENEYTSSSIPFRGLLIVALLVALLVLALWEHFRQKSCRP